MDPAGVQARHAGRIGVLMTVIAGVVFLLVIGTMLYGVLRHREPPPPPGSERDVEQYAHEEQVMTRAVGVALALTVLTLFTFLLLDLYTGRAIAALARGPAAEEALTIEVTGHQWWWEVTYDDPTPARRLTTANEIHIPVGRPVRIKLSSNDVIHSLWVPRLQGKKDLVPGYTTETWLKADEPGVYRGQCAEFCGHQHAKMAMLVIAQPAAEFAAWYDAQLAPAAPPADSVSAKGEEAFLAHACVMCHTIRGTPAGASVAPDLTHIASRRTIAAGTLPNTRGHLAGWIVDPQRIKPGTKMPPNPLAPDELQALLTYLGGLR
jgi:cytochrome c oxidase subunit 2